MTKSEAIKQFNEQYQKLTDSQQESFSRIALRLLDETYLIREKEADKKDYSKASDLINVLRPYFAIIDFDAFADRERGLIYIRTQKDSNRIRFLKMETIIALILRYVYDDESRKASINSAISTTVGHLAQEIQKTEIYADFTGRERDFREALKSLKRYKLIDFDGDLTGTTPIKIYRSVLLVIDTDSLDVLKARLDKFKGGVSDEENQETEAD